MNAAKSRWLSILDIVTIVFLVAATLMVFFYAPMEKTMGQVQRVFYFHVSEGWVGMLGFFFAMVAGIIYLRTHDRRWDIMELAGIEIGLVFMLVCIVTGSIWAYPAWNTWWTWDPRLTTATICELAYAAYLMLRSGIEDPERRARFGAVYSIIAFVSVPLTFFSIRLWSTIHPVIIGSNEAGATGSFNMSPRMTQTFMFSLLTFSIVFIDLFWHRARLGHLADEVETRKMKLVE
jgi:heme exporter protein C